LEEQIDVAMSGQEPDQRTGETGGRPSQSSRETRGATAVERKNKNKNKNKQTKPNLPV
jgi:hypothetical protein